LRTSRILLSITTYSLTLPVIDKYGNRLLDLCRSLELFFVNGRVGTDCGIGQPTCNNSNSMIDYALISPTLFRSVVDFNVLTFDPILRNKPVNHYQVAYFQCH
jgi:hypothetical protein